MPRETCLLYTSAYECVAKILRSANIEYVKWDMNRQLSDIGSLELPADQMGELYHRYVLAVYEMQERMMTEFPHLLLENCSGGGARFDPGMPVSYTHLDVYKRQGTTSSRCILFDKGGNICSMAQKEFTQIYPKPGWVEHNPVEIWSSQLAVLTEAMAMAGADGEDICGIGITNQRETTIVWDKETGEPVYNAIVWQCRRTAPKIDELVAAGYGEMIRERTGLVPDAYFSGTKIAWILDNVPGARERAEKGELLFGTVDSWLIYNLTKGKVHVTDYTNASRTMIFDIHKLCWDQMCIRDRP